MELIPESELRRLNECIEKLQTIEKLHHVDSYYSESAIRERCVKMVVERRNILNSRAPQAGEVFYKTSIEEEADKLVKYITSGEFEIIPDEDRKWGH